MDYNLILIDKKTMNEISRRSCELVSFSKDYLIFRSNVFADIEFVLSSYDGLEKAPLAESNGSFYQLSDFDLLKLGSEDGIQAAKYRIRLMTKGKTLEEVCKKSKRGVYNFEY